VPHKLNINDNVSF